MGRFSKAWDEFADEVDLAELALDPDEIFSGVRANDPDTGRTQNARTAPTKAPTGLPPAGDTAGDAD